MTVEDGIAAGVQGLEMLDRAKDEICKTIDARLGRTYVSAEFIAVHRDGDNPHLGEELLEILIALMIGDRQITAAIGRIVAAFVCALLRVRVVESGVLAVGDEHDRRFSSRHRAGVEGDAHSSALSWVEHIALHLVACSSNGQRDVEIRGSDWREVERGRVVATHAGRHADFSQAFTCPYVRAVAPFAPPKPAYTSLRVIRVALSRLGDDGLFFK